MKFYQIATNYLNMLCDEIYKIVRA